MSRIFVTSDTHFGHKKIIKYETWASFDTVLERDHAILDGIMERNPNKRDQLYVLGDFLMYTTLHPEIAKRWDNLPFLKKRLILGNHDDVYTVSHYFDTVEAYLTRSFQHYKILFSHMPVRRDYSQRWDFNIHGHDHKNKICTPMQFNVNVDARKSYVPLTLEEIVEEVTSSSFKLMRNGDSYYAN